MAHQENPLGQLTEYPQTYSPQLLFPIARAAGRVLVGVGEESAPLPFQGEDVWTHYEVSWLDAAGKPRVGIAEIRVPADSPCLIESKSLKLYFNSLNFHRFDDEQLFLDRVTQDLSAVAAAPVRLRFLSAHDLAVQDFPGGCLDDIPLEAVSFELSPATLRAEGKVVAETLHSHLLRSNCPVTNQPDWGSVLVRYEGPAIDRAGLLAYLVSYRNHADFHEQCVERIFMDIQRHCQPSRLTVYARYTRRGGLDINPFRSNFESSAPSCRMARQ